MSEVSVRNAPTTSTGQLVETPEELAYELRAAEGATWVGGKLVVGIGAFFFAGLAFAYFYLRSANDENLWRPHGITAPVDLGAAIFSLVAFGSLLNFYGTMRLRRGPTVDWEVAGWVGVGAYLLAVGFQIWELTRLGFQPGSSGYSSCFVGWAGLNTALLLFGAYWLETLLARTIRLRRATIADGGAGISALSGARLHRANLEAVTYFLGFTAFINLVFWVLFYLVV